MIRAIIFDAYGTLISTGNGSVEATRKMLNQLNVLIDPVIFYKDWKLTHKINIENIGEFLSEYDIFIRDLQILLKKYSINEMPENAVSFMIHSLTGRKAFSETKDVIDSLSSKYTICIGSTSDTEPLLENIKENSLTFDYVFTSQSLRIYKPQKEFYEKILSILKISSNEAVFVGDSLIDDVLGPQQLGIYSVWLNRLKVENNTDIIPDAIIASLYDLPNVLKKLK
ncbi:MAG: HAD family hydrolase [Bacillota bacterium]|nr:HAD family hydrolase [Bacillota bacterium]